MWNLRDELIISQEILIFSGKCGIDFSGYDVSLCAPTWRIVWWAGIA